MLRTGEDGGVRGNGPRTSRRVAPASLRVALITLLAAAVSGAVGGVDGFWLSVPFVMLAGSVAAGSLGAVLCAAPALAAGAAAAWAVHHDPIPPLWLVIVAPGACLLVLQGMASRLRRERDAMVHAAYSDPLTGLANRRMLMSVAEHEIQRHQRADQRFTVVMLDLDGFKQVNDRYGHAAGDEMLCDVAGALTRALRSQDTIARLGGDEFCVIAPETENPRALVEKVIDAVGQAASGYEALQTSAGLAAFPEDGTTIEQLLRTADDRLLAAKRKRHNMPQRHAA